MNNRRHLTLTLLFLAFTSSLLSANRPAAFKLLDYGAVPDGKTKNTAAIAACAQAGGGTILFPAGQYLAGSILPESDQTLHLEAGAELLYSGDPADSPLVAWRWECTNVFTRAPLIYAEGKHTIAITGRGQNPPAGQDAAANQAAWRALYDRIEPGEKLAAADFTRAAQFLRTSLIGLYHRKNVLVADITLFKSPI